MAQEHLDQARLLAIYRGDTGDFAALEHLASCADCQQAFDDTRWFLLLRRLPGLVRAVPHPEPDVLAAYRSHALSPPRIAEVERHIRACDRCAAHYGDERMAEAQAQYVSPAAASVRRTIKQFRPRRLRRLGTVVVSGLRTRALRLVFVPPGLGVASIASAQFDWMPELRRRHRQSIPPAAASKRADRLLSTTEDQGLGDEETTAELSAALEADATVCEETFGGARELASVGSSPEPDDARTLRIPADGLDLLLTPAVEDDRVRLTVRLLPHDGRLRAAGIRVRVRGPEGRESEDTTDDDGRASLPLDAGATEIIVESQPPLALDLGVSD